MLIAMVFAVMALALLFPESGIGGALRRLLIEEPARRLGRLRRGHLLLALVLFALLAAAYAIGRQDGMIVAGQLGAEGLSYAMAFDLATWLDVTAIALILAATTPLRAAIRLATDLTRRSVRRLMAPLRSRASGRARRARAARPPRGGEDRDRPAPGLAWA